jgi:catechol 2,3-dioxygenase-like lactoylglutathione lyase family enzyme
MTGDGNAVGDLYLATVVLNVQDMRRAVDFWCAALGYQPRETEWDPSFVMLVHPEGRGTPVSLQLADRGPAEPVRVHLDLYTSEQSRHVERLVDLGATRVSGWPYPPQADFVVLRDPDGNAVLGPAESEPETDHLCRQVTVILMRSL